MNCHTKFARLSRTAMTSQHGRLLQDSGFTKQDLTLASSLVLGRTITPPLGALCFPSGTVTGRWSSGRPAIQSIPRKAGLSTSRLRLQEILFMQRFGMSREQMMATVLPKTSSALSKLEHRAARWAMQSWGLCFPTTPSHFSSLRTDRSISGSTPTKRDAMQVLVLGDSFDLSASSRYP